VKFQRKSIEFSVRTGHLFVFPHALPSNWRALTDEWAWEARPSRSNSQRRRNSAKSVPAPRAARQRTQLLRNPLDTISAGTYSPRPPRRRRGLSFLFGRAGQVSRCSLLCFLVGPVLGLNAMLSLDFFGFRCCDGPHNHNRAVRVQF
jgi:hypothetical protein